MTATAAITVVAAAPTTTDETTERDDDMGGSVMTVVRLNVPPDHTPEEEAALVARVAAAYAEMDPDTEVDIQVAHPEEVDYRTTKAAETGRWG